MSAVEKIKFAFAFPVSFISGVLAVALLHVFQIGGFKMFAVLGGGLFVIVVVDHYMNRFGNKAIMNGLATFEADPDAKRAKIEADDAKDAKSHPATRNLQIAGFVTGIAVCVILSPSDVIDWVQRRPFL